MKLSCKSSCLEGKGPKYLWENHKYQKQIVCQDAGFSGVNAELCFFKSKVDLSFYLIYYYLTNRFC